MSFSSQPIARDTGACASGKIVDIVLGKGEPTETKTVTIKAWGRECGTNLSESLKAMKNNNLTRFPAEPSSSEKQVEGDVGYEANSFTIDNENLDPDKAATATLGLQTLQLSGNGSNLTLMDEIQ
jgi:putative salt-induced outer membrane protein YdiY